MSTQHPDNVARPFFTDRSVLRGEDEIREAYYAYSHLGCTEQMWDYEGKEVDGFVVKKLLSRYPTYFADRRLGETLFLTLRVPNPRVEVAEAKVLAETLESIPRSYDAARTVHGDGVPAPIFEVILPMTSSSEEMNRVYHYYRRFVASKEQQRCHDLSLGDWLGAFQPDSIRVIPLIEDREHLLEADRIVDGYLVGKDLPWQRVFLARSDPALNYGQIGAVLLLKGALRRLAKLEERLGIPLYPILGAGSAPFRGNLRPGRIGETLTEYPSVQTFTIQSAFKYDYPAEEARGAIVRLSESLRGAALEVDAAGCIELVEKVSARYAACVEALAPVVNALAAHVPQRRARRLHIGLFGYSRRLEGHEGVHLPRAIRFCAALYSIGLPPEVLGVGALSRSELDRVREAYVTIDRDMEDSLRYLCEANLRHLPAIVQREVRVARDAFACTPDPDHADAARRIFACLRDGEPSGALAEGILRAGYDTSSADLWEDLLQLDASSSSWSTASAEVPMKGMLAGLCVVLVAFGVVASGETLSGFVHGELDLDFDGPWPKRIDYDLEMGIEYAIGDWSFGGLLDIEEHGLEDLVILTTGPLGAVNVYSLYWLTGLWGMNPDPGVDLWADWDNAFWMDIAGIEMWAFSSIKATDFFDWHLSGAGLAIGGHGSAGAVEFWAEIQFNLGAMVPLIYWNGLEYIIEKNLACDLIDVLDPTCELDFSFAEAYVDFPFCCADATAWIAFDWDGFYAVEFWVRDIPIGETGLSLEWVDLWFEADWKDLELWFDLDIGQVLCIEPFITLDMDGPAEIEGIEVDALELVCTLGDVTARVSELFTDDDYYMGIDGAIYPRHQLTGWMIPPQCVDRMWGAEQAIAIEVNREGCCGGDMFFGLYSFFDADLNGVMFDWLGLRARAVSPVTPSLSMYIETWIWYDGVETILLGFDYTWGTLRSVTSDWTCCW